MKQAAQVEEAPPVTPELSRFLAATSLADIPAEVRTRAKYLILDGLGCGLVGAKLGWSERAVNVVTELDGSGCATVWGWNRKVPPQSAALLNGTFVQGFELDDYHSRGPLHSASCVLPSVMATAERLGGVDGKRFLEAVTLGFEVGPRVGMAMGGLQLVSRGWHCGAVFGVMASAAGAAKVRGLDADGFENAFGNAATQACGLMSAQFEAMVKRMHSGFATRSGLLGAALAAGGFTGIKNVIERDYGGYATNFTRGDSVDLSQITSGLGDRWEVLEIAVKPPYACAGHLHSPIEAAEALRLREGFDLGSVERIEIGVSEPMLHHGGWELERPITAIAAQMNIAYAVVVTLLDGTPSVPQFSPARLDADDVWALLPKAEVFRDESIDARGTDGRFGCKVSARFRDGRRDEIEVPQPWGGRARPLTNDEIAGKFDRIAALVMDRGRSERLKALVLDIEACTDVQIVADALGEEVRAPY